MKNATVAIATTFALVTMAMAVAIALRQASVDDVVRASNALNASADAKSAGARPAPPVAPATALNAAPGGPRPQPALSAKSASAEAGPLVEHRSAAEAPASAAPPAAASPSAANSQPAASAPAGGGEQADGVAPAVKPPAVEPPKATPDAAKPPTEKARKAELQRGAARPGVHAARWSGEDGAGAYHFSGSFAGCQYRGVVSAGGARIERSC
jgi:hypothetical protein